MKYILGDSITIDKSFHETRAYIANIKKWNEWSPWLLFDPHAQTSCGHNTYGQPFMSWKGKFVGEGCITQVGNHDHLLEYNLVFFNPSRSQSKTYFRFQEKNGSTKVTWSMEGKLPFSLFTPKKLIIKMLTNDYRRGLLRIKYMLENKRIPMTLEFMDTPKLVHGFSFYGIQNQGAFEELGNLIPRDFEYVSEAIKQKKVKIKLGYCFYTKMSLLKDLFQCISGFSTKQDLVNTSLVKKAIPDHKSIKVTLQGDYQFMESAWSGIINHVRTLKLKPNRKVPPYEKHLIGPHETNRSDQYITEIHYPVK